MPAQVKPKSGPPTGKLSSPQRTDYRKTALNSLHACLPNLDKDNFKKFNATSIHQLSTSPLLEYRLLVGGTHDGEYQVHACIGEAGYNKTIFMRGNAVMKYKDIPKVAFNKPFAYVNRGNPTTSAGRAQVEALVLYYFMEFLIGLGRDRMVDVTSNFWTDFGTACGYVNKAGQKRQLENLTKRLDGTPLKQAAERDQHQASVKVSRLNKISAKVSNVDRSTQVDIDFISSRDKRKLGPPDNGTENSAKRHNGGAKPTYSELDVRIKHLTKAFAVKSQEADVAKLDLEQGRASAMTLVSKTKAQVSSLETKLGSLQSQCKAKDHELRGMTNQIRDLQGGQQKEMMSTGVG